MIYSNTHLQATNKKNTVIFSAFSFLFGFIFIATAMAGVGLISSPEIVYAQSATCPFSAQEGRIIFNFPVDKLIGSGDISEPAIVDIPAGDYRVNLASYDSYGSRASHSDQTNEVYYVKFKIKHDGGGHTVIATSGNTQDLEDGVETASWSGVVNELLTISSDINRVYPFNGGSDSLYAVCGTVDLIEQENTPPIITLTDGTVTLTVGDTYTEPGYDADDTEDGNLKSEVTIDDGGLDTNTVGTYTLTYDVEDSGGLTDTKTRDVVVEPEVVVDAPYCGDGIVNQDWEEVDSGSEDSTRCLIETNQCREIALARVVVDGTQNWGSGNVTSDIFLGSSTNKIPAGTWFPIYLNNSFITDSDMTSAGYEDVPGIAVERSSGKLKTLLFGSYPSDGSKAHANGHIEFFNIEVVSQSSDDSGNNKLEKGFDGEKTLSAGQDEVWLNGGETDKSYFWLTVTTADDGFWSHYGDAPICEVDGNTPPIITLTDGTVTLTVGDTYTEPGYDADDTEDGNLKSEVTIDDGGLDTNTVGTYTLTYDVEDSGGLTDTKTRDVVVEEGSTPPPPPPVCTSCGGGGSSNFRPEIYLFEDLEITITTDNVYTEGGYKAEDREDGDITENVAIDFGGLSTSTPTVGEYTITYDVEDSTGWAAETRERTVTVTQGTNPPVIPPPQVCNYLEGFSRIGNPDNDPIEVAKVQVFLNEFEGTNLDTDGFFDEETDLAVKAFQEKHRLDILDPWNHDEPTGYVYLTTRKKINEIYCEKEFPLSLGQLDEIDLFANRVIVTPPSTTVGVIDSTGEPTLRDLIGEVDGNDDTRSGDTLAGATEGTNSENLASVGSVEDENLAATGATNRSVIENIAVGVYKGIQSVIE